MKVVIDIPDDNYKRIRELAEVNGLSNNLMGYSLLAIAHGTVLPKGHGRLIDADEEIKCARKWIDHPDKYISQRNKDFIYYLENAETVIPADK